MNFGYEYVKGQFILQFVPGKPSETDAFNEGWALMRRGKEIKIRFEDWEPGVPQIVLMIGKEQEGDDEYDEDNE